MIWSFIFFLSFTIASDFPVIGILSLPPDSTLYDDKHDFIPYQYPAFLQFSGAQIVPIFLSNDENYLENILSRVNGLLLPGGAANLVKDNELTDYLKQIKQILKIARKFNDNGDYFPIWGTCLGFEAILIDIFGPEAMDSNLDDENFLHTLIPHGDFWKFLPHDVMEWIKKEPVLPYHHNRGFYESTVKKHNMHKKIDITGWSERNGKHFLASFKDKKYPFYGV